MTDKTRKMKNLISIFLLTSVTTVTLTLGDEVTLQEFTTGNNLFTGSVYKELLKINKDNFLVSPFSAESVLALTQFGAKDSTAEEIRTALHLPNDQKQIETTFKSLLPTLRKNEDYELNTANKVYVKENFQLKDEFKRIAADVFGADLEGIDFTKQSEAASTMNQWVEGQTNSKIQNLIDPAVLTNQTRAILINALYFKGNWSTPFEKYLTSKKDFFKTAKDVVPVDTMQDSSIRNYYESPELSAKFVELPFEGADASMTIVLPNEKEGLAALESQIDQVFVAPKYSREYVNVAIPKFRVETEIDFNGILKNLGINKAFDDQEADLSGIAGDKGDLVIDKVLQKTFVDVNEVGVEAAAATYVAVGVPLSGFFPITPPKDFIADHPFIFYIKVKDLILFAGRVTSPSSSA